MSNQENGRAALGSYRVLEVTDESGLYCGQLLGSLGADVIKVERPGGDPARNIGPFFHDIPDPEESLFWLAYNTNKRGITLDIEAEDGRETCKRLVKWADVVIESFAPGYMDRLGLGYAELSRINPGLVMTSISPFGQTGPHRDYKASDLICWAMGGLLSLSGDPDRPPVRVGHIPFAYLTANMDAAWATAIALYWRGTSGKGQHIDVSIQESIIKTTLAIYEMWELTGEEPQRGSTRSTGGHGGLYLRVVWPAKDGFVRYRLFPAPLGTAENLQLVKWIDEAGIADDFFRGIDWPNFGWEGKSLEEAERVHDYLARLFLSKTTAELAEEAFRRDIKVEPISTPKDILRHPQLEARDYWQQLEHPELGATISYPGRFCLLPETPGKLRRRAPHIGEHNQEILEKELAISSEEAPAEAKNVEVQRSDHIPRKALEGVKVAAFIQGVAGPLAAVILAGYGAQVLRIESRTRLEWERQSGGPYVGNKPSHDSAAGYLSANAGELGISLNLKHPKAMEVMTRVIKWADVVMENFSGGTMVRMRLGYEDLKKIKPDIIMLSAAIYGQTGPFAGVGGYGGTLTALTGLPHITGFPDQTPQFPGFAITDYIAPRANVLAIVAALDHRRRTGRGQYIDAAQVESTIPLLTPILLEYQVNGREATRMGNRSTYAAPHSVYRCKGDERWCAITVFTDEEWQRFGQVIGSPAWTRDPEFATLTDRLKNVDKLDRLVEEWTVNYPPEEVMTLMQNAGVAAGVVQGGPDLGRDPQLRHRQFYCKLDHPGMGDFTYGGLPAQFSETPYEIRRAPFLGEHNEEVYLSKLGMSAEEFARLTAEGVFE